jgi:probable HAF family extracellular repeat protein
MNDISVTCPLGCLSTIGQEPACISPSTNEEVIIMTKTIAILTTATILFLGCDRDDQPVMPSASEELAEGKGLSKFGTNYRYVDLGTLGGDYSEAWGINDRGQVVGFSYTASRKTHAFLWEKGVMKDLGTLEGDNGYSEARAINAWGHIVGQSSTGTGVNHAVLWKGGKIIDLGTLEGMQYSEAWDINGRCQVVGYSGDYGFLWKRGVITNLSTLGGTQWETTARGINLWGHVVGYTIRETGDRYAYVLKHGVLTDLGWGNNSEAMAINNHGHIVGYGITPTGDPQPRLRKAGNPIDFGVLGAAVDINDRGQIAGIVIPEAGAAYRAAAWKGGIMTELGPDFSSATAINNLGMVTGWCDGRAALWIPWPDWPSAAESGPEAKEGARQ